MAIDFSKTIDAPLTFFGKSVTYTPKGGTAVSLSAIRDDCAVALLSADGVSVLEGTCTFTLKKSALVTALGAAITPNIGDTITSSGTVYDVKTADDDGEDLAWEIHCVRRR